MVLITLREIVDALIMTAAVGYIFMDLFRPHVERRFSRPRFELPVFLFSCLLAAPALIMHELAHKFVAIAFGLQAVFHAAYLWLGIGILLKLMNVGFIFFVPGYVQISSGAASLQHSLIAFAGPFLNLTLFGIAWAVLRRKRHFTKKQYLFWYVTKQLNLFLFVFNMLPLPLFDGWKVYAGLWQFFFS